MWEDVYQVYRRIEDAKELLASDLNISDAMIFMEAWMLRNYNDTVSTLELHRQPMGYGLCGREEDTERDDDWYDDWESDRDRGREE